MSFRAAGARLFDAALMRGFDYVLKTQNEDGSRFIQSPTMVLAMGQ